MKKSQATRHGLILLVVLGMLTLFSLLAVTYVVVAGQARTSSVAMAKVDHRGTPPDRLLDQAIRQVIRGTRDTDSALWRHSLLEDMNGSIESVIDLKPRTSAHDDGSRFPSGGGYSPPYPIGVPTGHAYGPQIIGGQFLKIPIEWESSKIPLTHDAWTGRILTFETGPLANQSFRILRSVGQVEQADLATYGSIQYSILIDLTELPPGRLLTWTTVATGTLSRDVAGWTSLETNGAALLYGSYTAGSTVADPYRMFINSAAFNGEGIGIQKDSSGDWVTTSDRTPDRVLYNYNQGVPANQLASPFNTIPDALLPNYSYTNLLSRKGFTYTHNGDTDERYDAADYNNYFLTRVLASASTSDDVTPAFHRPAIINYIAGLDPKQLTLSDSSFTPKFFQSFLEVMQRAVARPISYRVLNFPDSNTNSTITLTNNTMFNGGTAISATSGLRNPQLVFDWNQKNNPPAQEAFDAWLRWHMRGPWDVDNDDDGINDSVWIDLNYPLVTSPEGKLLKILAAFYIQDMDGKIDMNAAGSQNQGDPGFGIPISGDKYAYNQLGTAAFDWPQGLGRGPADLYVRHLFNNNADCATFFSGRYEGSGYPGTNGTDDNMFFTRGLRGSVTAGNSLVRNTPSNEFLPGLPMSNHGRIGLGLDLLGNPILLNVSGSTLSETVDDPYDFRPLSTTVANSKYSVADYERLVRFNDLDRAGIPSKASVGNSLKIRNGATANANYLKRVRSLSPRSVHLSTPAFPMTFTGAAGSSRVSSFVDFIEAIAQDIYGTTSYPVVDNAVFAQCFPIEFSRGLPFDLNRPLGNGIDDDGDGEIDEQDEAAGEVEYYGINSYTASPAAPKVAYTGLVGTSNYDAASEGSYTGNRAKQLYARHLYCLAQLLLPFNPSPSPPTAPKNLYIFPNQPDQTTPVDDATRARILAQWAANVVDYRDADSAMTRFAYDPDPFTNKAPSGSPKLYWNPDTSHVVFGVEQPELLITETLAFHDMRVIKEDKGPSSPPLYHQVRLPEGSLFLEFFCPRSTAANQTSVATDDILPGTPRSLYGKPGSGTSSLYLDLGKTVSDTAGNQFPVWRVLLLNPNVDGGVLTEDAPTKVYGKDTDAWVRQFDYSYQIGASSAGLNWRIGTNPSDRDPAVNGYPRSATAIPAPTVSRVLWFAGVTPTAANITPIVSDPRKVFFYKSGFNGLEGGQYLVVGPRDDTYFGTKDSETLPRNHRPNNHRIALYDGAGQYHWTQIWRNDNSPGLWKGANPLNAPAMAPAQITLMQGYVRPCVTMVAGSLIPDVTAWPNAVANTPGSTSGITIDRIGLNISEPTADAYYPEPTENINKTDNGPDPQNGAKGFKNLSVDGYYDLSGGTISGTQVRPFDGSGTKYFLNQFKWPTDSAESDEIPQAKTQFNWSAAVLQRLADPQAAWNATLNPYITVDWMPIDLTVFSGEDKLNNGDFYLASRQKTLRTIQNNPTTTATVTPRAIDSSRLSFLSYHTHVTGTKSPKNSSANAYFKFELPVEMDTSATPQTVGVRPNPTDTFTTLGYLNDVVQIRGADPAPNNYVNTYFQGSPSITPLAPVFANRDFVNSLELTNVLLSSPGAVNQEFSVTNPTGISSVAPFRYTMDFEEKTKAVATDMSSRKRLGMFFEVVGVQSPWSDSWRSFRPDKVVSSGSTANDYLTQVYRAPANFAPTYREAGRINLNTVDEVPVYQALFGLTMPMSSRSTAATALTGIPFADELNTYRGGGLSLDTSVINRTGKSGNPKLDQSSPTEIPKVFTSPLGSYQFASTNQKRYDSLDAGVLFKDSSANRIMNANKISSFDMGGGVIIPNTHIFNYPAGRLQNLVTDRSNVFNVRVTLGYFEFNPATGGIGLEHGYDQGRAVRHRAFYMIDRSIPVGFKPGKDYNTDNVIIQRRIIE